MSAHKTWQEAYFHSFSFLPVAIKLHNHSLPHSFTSTNFTIDCLFFTLLNLHFYSREESLFFSFLLFLCMPLFYLHYVQS